MGKRLGHHGPAQGCAVGHIKVLREPRAASCTCPSWAPSCASVVLPASSGAAGVAAAREATASPARRARLRVRIAPRAQKTPRGGWRYGRCPRRSSSNDWHGRRHPHCGRCGHCGRSGRCGRCRRSRRLECSGRSSRSSRPAIQRPRISDSAIQRRRPGERCSGPGQRLSDSASQRRRPGQRFGSPGQQVRDSVAQDQRLSDPAQATGQAMRRTGISD
jgi:hypothetical protein